MLTLRQIIEEAEFLVPDDTIDTSMNVLWLNHINQEFFNVVKIPKVQSFLSEKGKDEYVLNSNIRQKNIDLVMIGLTRYYPLNENTRPLTNWYHFSDTTNTLTVSPAPYDSDMIGYVRYHQIATTTFVPSNLNATPDAPEEYHYLYIPALCAYRAKAQDDLEKARMYENDYRSGLNMAAMNYQSQQEVTP